MKNENEPRAGDRERKERRRRRYSGRVQPAAGLARGSEGSEGESGWARARGCCEVEKENRAKEGEADAFFAGM